MRWWGGPVLVKCSQVSVQLDDSLKSLMKTRLKADQMSTSPVRSAESFGASVWISLHLFVHYSLIHSSK